MWRNFSERLDVGGFLDQRGHGIDDYGFSFFYNSQSFVVLSLFFSPFLISEGFVGIQLVDFFSDQISELEFSVCLNLFLISKKIIYRLYLMGIFSPNSLVNYSILFLAAAISASKLAKSASHSS